MGRHSSADKQGLQSSGRKQQSTRHATDPTPATSPVPGAFGEEGLDRETEGKPRVPADRGPDSADDRPEDGAREDEDLER
jgi:hypothetical protein